MIYNFNELPAEEPEKDETLPFEEDEPIPFEGY